MLERLKQIGHNANVEAGLRVFIARKAGRYIGEFLDGVGEATILACIQEGKWLTDYIPKDVKADWIHRGMQFQKNLDAFSDAEVYSWIPPEKRLIFEGAEGGRTYLLGQIAEIRRVLIAAQPEINIPHMVKAHRVISPDKPA